MVYFDVFRIYFNVFYIYIVPIDIFIVYLNVCKCIHSVAEPKYFYEPLLLIFWINRELFPRPWGSSYYILMFLTRVCIIV
jgi:hypothetical protein